MRATQRPALFRYGVAVAAVYLALVLLALPKIGQGFVFVLFFAVFVSAWYGGIGPGLLATTLIVASALVYFLRAGEPLLPWRIPWLGTFVCAGGLISALVEALHAARRRAERSEQEARHHEQVLRRSEEALKEADHRKDEFLAMLAHELRNPLATLSSAVHVVRLRENAADLDWGLRVMERQTEHLARLIDDLMDLSRISQGKIQLRKELLDLRGVVDHAVDDVRAWAEERRHVLSVSMPSEPLWSLGDATRLRQILVNLLTNAVKYTEPGGRIDLAVEHAGAGHVIRVRDNGVGIAPEMLGRIFELYSQADRTLDRAEGGLGIGLTLVRRLAELHGGSVSVASDGVGRGSEFTVRLPAAEAPSPVTPAPPAGLHRPAASGQRRILIVGDDPEASGGLSRLLGARGFEVLIANDGPSAIAMARAQRPDAILLEIGSPGQDGCHVAEQVRRDERLRGVTLIALSGSGQGTDLARSRDAGIHYCIVQPVNIDLLLKLLSQPVNEHDEGNPGPHDGVIVSSHREVIESPW